VQLSVSKKKIPPYASDHEWFQKREWEKCFLAKSKSIAVYCCVDDEWQQLTSGQPIRHRGFQPAWSDAPVITMEIVGEYQGMDADKDIWKYFRDHWLCLFPKLPRSSFVRLAANLWQDKQRLQQGLARKLGAFDDDVHLIDGLPITLCCFTYACRCRSFRGEADYGYCAAKKEHFYGFRGHLNISAIGVITGFTLTPGNGDYRCALWDILSGISGLQRSDLGYINQFLCCELRPYGINLQTPLRSNMRFTLPQSWVRLLQNLRRLIETVNSQLSERFNFERVRARDMWHLTSRCNRKLLAHTVCCFLNRLFGREILQFDGLITD
jgi:hypothetical protein